MKVNTLRTSSTLTFWWDKPDTQISEYIYYLDGMETGRTEKTHFTLSSLESSRGLISRKLHTVLSEMERLSIQRRYRKPSMTRMRIRKYTSRKAYS